MFAEKESEKERMTKRHEKINGDGKIVRQSERKRKRDRGDLDIELRLIDCTLPPFKQYCRPPPGIFSSFISAGSNSKL